jgi:hypothetical protein
MTNAQIRFDDGFGYEQLRLAGRRRRFVRRMRWHCHSLITS